MEFIDLAQQCAPLVHIETMQSIVKAESAFDPWALNVNNGDNSPAPKADSLEHAIKITQHYIDQGFSVDVGLAQINSRNFERLDLSIKDAFDPCQNLTASQTILVANYERFARKYGEGDQALLAAFSAYNTGNETDGFNNGYVHRVAGLKQYIVPALKNTNPADIPRPTRWQAPAVKLAPIKTSDKSVIASSNQWDVFTTHTY